MSVRASGAGDPVVGDIFYDVILLYDRALTTEPLFVSVATGIARTDGTMPNTKIADRPLRLIRQRDSFPNRLFGLTTAHIPECPLFCLVDDSSEYDASVPQLGANIRPCSDRQNVFTAAPTPA